MNFIDICAGGGGLSLGLMKAGFNPILMIDNDKNCVKTLQINHPNIDIIQNNFIKHDYSNYKDIDLLVGGVPCQSFSQSGKRKGLDDPRGELIFKFIDIINEIKPKVFLIENVKELLTHNKGETFKSIVKYIKENEEYEIHYKCLNTMYYNVPQKRERLMIIGIHKNMNKKYEFPKENKENKILKDVLNDVPESLGYKYSQTKLNLYKYIPQGGCWINLPKELQEQYLGKSYLSGGGKRGILYRLSLDKPSLTLLCSPSQKQTERCHPTEDRPLTIREYARIQTFPDDYKFYGSINTQYKQIGNAVPVNLAKEIGYSIVDFLNKYNFSKFDFLDELLSVFVLFFNSIIIFLL